MRYDQPQGLPLAAKAFLDEFEKLEYCEKCGRPEPRQLEVIGKCKGFDDHPLHRHQLKIDGTADEFLQATLWSSGPMFFLGLQVSDGQRFVWTEEEIEQAT